MSMSFCRLRRVCSLNERQDQKNYFHQKPINLHHFLVELMRGGLFPRGAVVELKFHGVIKFHGAVVTYAAVNGAEKCPEGRGAWRFNVNPTGHVNGVVKLISVVVSYAAANGNGACPEGRGDWGVNTDPPSAAAATGADPPSVAAVTGAWEAFSCTVIDNVPMLYAVGANNAAASAAVCPN